MPRAASSSRSRRPLKELPLDHFLDPDSIPDTPHRATGKRASSPAVFSPAKRRILASEGVFASGGTRLRALPVHATSPIKKLDFGPAQNSPTKATRASSGRRGSSAAPSSPASPTVVAAASTVGIESPMVLPREMSPVDTQSIHYPGFIVHYDPFGVADEAPDVPIVPTKEDADEYKENVAPRRRSSRKSVATLDAHTKKPYPDTKPTAAATPKLRTRTSPRTPKPVSRDRSASMTPTRAKPDVVLTRSTRATPKLDASQRRQLRRQLEDEVNEAG
ncbi:hypothetical protein HMN09_01408700 [Mycena chlorophos]|uniref:Uncharacterized protein n=1 Tax=Mycena chlorophos TaxID=658473 RepID=A0A8H6VQH1_MYCCL|nr:hypothetical protein HMN09_01408700 [Mycena chlorophos]